MAIEYKLPYTGSQLNEKLSKIDKLAEKTEIPTKVSELTNDSGFITTYTETDPTVPAWAKASTKPSYSKSEVGLGNVDNVKQYSASNPPPYPVTSVNGKTGAVTLDAAAVGARSSTWMPSASDVGALPNTYTPPNQTAEQVGADPKGTAVSTVSQHNTANDSHNDIRLELKAINDRLTAFFDSDNQTLDELSEIVAYITNNKSLIDSIATSKVSVADVINNLTTNVTNKPLSAAQGVVLKGLIDTLTNNLANYQPKGDYALASAIPTKVSQLTNDSGFIKSYTETDPTVPSWAKASTKPSYSKSEVGLGNVDNVKQYSASNPPPYPVTKVNNKTGVITLSASDVGALAASELNNAIDNALAQAKESGEFDGKAGASGVHVGSSAPTGDANVWIDTEGDASDEIGSAVLYTPQDLTEAQKEQARANIGVDTYLAEELAKRGQVQLEFVDSIEKMTDTNKFYVMDGFIYAYMLTEVESGPNYTNVLPLAINADKTPYIGTNGEKGYKTGYRLNSSRAETQADGRCCTGFIPVKYTDVIRFKNISHPTDGNNNGYIHFYGSDFTAKTGQMYEKSGMFDLEIVPSNITSIATGTNATEATAYMRLSTGIIDETSIITINEEIVEGGTTTGYAWVNTGLAFVPADYESRIVDLEKLTAVHTADIENLKEENANSVDITKWDAPIYDANISVFQLSEETAAKTNAACTPNDIYSLYDALMAKHSQYITKTDLGLCSDGVNHVYRYDFREPEPRHNSGYEWSETKTKAIIVSGIHYEWSGIYGLYYALEEIANNPELRNFRRNSHLIVVPCMNPYATIAANYGNSEGVKNANGVEIHRNFESGWVLTDSGTTHYGGAEPLSEVETRYVNDIMRENTDAALFLTCHSFADESFNFIWPSTATAYMCNMGYRLIDKLSYTWLEKYGDTLVGLDEYRTSDIPSWDNRLGHAHISKTPGTETRQGAKHGIQSANVEINGRFWTHGTKANPEPSMSAFTMSRGAEVYVNFLLMVFGVYDHKDKALYSPHS